MFNKQINTDTPWALYYLQFVYKVCQMQDCVWSIIWTFLFQHVHPHKLHRVHGSVNWRVCFVKIRRLLQVSNETKDDVEFLNRYRCCIMNTWKRFKPVLGLVRSAIGWTGNPSLGCVVKMVVDSILPHAVFGPNDHRKDAPPFITKSTKCSASSQRSFSDFLLG